MAIKNQRKTSATKPKAKKDDVLRHAEYYEMQETFDRLYAQSLERNTFDRLMELILNRENILLAYRNIKRNSGSSTPGTDGLTIGDIAKCSADDMVRKVKNIMHNYQPRAVRRKDIPKEGNPGKTRPLGIPCIWDRLVQQCILQVLEPICEARFSENSYGFRPNRSCENAMARAYRLMQMSNLHFVVEVDIKGFFDNVDHSKLIKQMWNMGIRDKTLIYIIRQMLKAPILMPDSSMFVPEKGTPQGGICSPLLANIVLNELDHWEESQWQSHPVTEKYKPWIHANGSLNKGASYARMRKTRLKEMYIVRYADDFRIFCRTRSDAVKTLAAVTQWLEERLRLQVSPEKTRVVNLKRQYSEFLGFKIKVHRKEKKHVVRSHICDKAVRKITEKAIEAVKEVAHPSDSAMEGERIRKYNSMVIGWHNYYRLATNVNLDFAKINYRLRKVWKARLRDKLSSKSKTAEVYREFDAVIQRYGKSEQLRYISGRPIAPIGYVKTQYPLHKRKAVNKYTPEGRKLIHDNLGISTGLMLRLMRQASFGRSTEYMDNRVSLFCAQYGRCAVTGNEFQGTDEIHCHHMLPKSMGGGDNYQNLVLIHPDVHTLIHAVQQETVSEYLSILQLNAKQCAKLNKYREMAGLNPITTVQSNR